MNRLMKTIGTNLKIHITKSLLIRQST